MAPDWMNVRNPLDVGPSGTFSRAFPLLLADDRVDMVLSIMVVPYEKCQGLGVQPEGLVWGPGKPSEPISG